MSYEFIKGFIAEGRNEKLSIKTLTLIAISGLIVILQVLWK